MNEFKVFDEYGNFIGEYAPRDNGCGILIPFIILLTAIYLVYAYFRSIFEAIAALGRGEVLKAIGNLIYPAVMTLIVWTLIVSNKAEVTAKEERFKSLCEGTRIELSGNTILITPQKEYLTPYNVVLLVNGEERLSVLVNMAMQSGTDLPTHEDINMSIKTLEFLGVWEYRGGPTNTAGTNCNIQIYP